MKNILMKLMNRKFKVQMRDIKYIFEIYEYLDTNKKELTSKQVSDLI